MQSAPFDMSLLVTTLNDVIAMKLRTEQELTKLYSKTDEESKEAIDHIQSLDRHLNAEISRISGELSNRIEGYIKTADATFESELVSIKAKVASIPHLKGEPGTDGKDADDEAIVKALGRKFGTKFEEFATSTSKKFEKMFEQLGKKLVEELKKSLNEMVEKRFQTIDATVRGLSSKVALGSGGGGMGSIKLFKFTGDGSTTEFTLPDVPTQDGAGVFAFSNSARLHNNEHFTVSGKTLTTTYTPADGEIIDGHIIT